MKPSSFIRTSLALTGCSLLAVSSASAQSTSNTWDTDAAGNWTDATNWVGNTNYAGGADNTATLGDFITNNRIITLDAPITIGNITASDGSHNYTISGANILTLDRTTGTPTINVSNGSGVRTLTISSVIAGSDGLNKVGPGTLSLSAANTYTGTTTISQGTLNLGNGTSTGSLASTALALGGGTLSYTRTGSQTQNFSTTAINAGSSSVSTVAGNTLGLGTITQSAGGTLNVGTTGTITTSNSNVNNILGPWAFFNTGGSTTYATVSGGTIFGLTYAGGADGTTAAASTDVNDTLGAVNYTLASAGTLGASASINTLRYTGAAGSLATSTAFTANGLLNAGSGTLTFSGAVTIGSTNELVVNAATNNIIFSSAIGNNGSNASSFTKVGTGSVTLSGNNTYTGLTVVGAGTLNVNHNNALGSSTGDNSHTILSAVTGSSTSRIVFANGISTAENITITGDTENGLYQSVMTSSGTSTLSGTITLAGSGGIRLGGGTINWTGNITQSGTSNKLLLLGTNTVSNALAINGGDLIIVNNGTTQLNGVNPTDGTGIGNTELYSDSGTATLRLGVSNAIRTDGDLTYMGPQTTRFNLNGFNQTIRGLTNATGTSTRTVNNDASGTTSTLTVGNGGGDYTFGGTIINATTGTGIVAFTKVGSGTQTLTGTNTYTGVTTLTGGVLSVGTIGNGGVAGNLGQATNAATNIVFDGGTLQYTGANATSDRAFTINAGKTATIETTNNISFAGATGASTNGGLTKTGTGTLTLTGANTYTGTTTITTGTLALSGAGSIASSTLIRNNSTLDVRSVTGSTFNIGPSQTYGGTGTLLATGTTVVASGTLSPGNSPGTVTQNGGTLQLAVGGDLNWQVYDANGVAGTGYDTVSLINGATLDLSALSAGNTYNINLWSLSGIGPDVNGNAINFNNALNYAWTLFSTGSVISGFNTNLFTINTAAFNGTNGFTNTLNGNFSLGLADGGTDLVLTYTAIPEPTTALLGGLGLLLLLRRRR